MMVGILGSLVGSLLALGCLICFILVLVRQFKSDGAVHGVIGIVTCGIWTFIWGWLKADRENIKTLMTIWSFLGIAWIILKVLVGLEKL